MHKNILIPPFVVVEDGNEVIVILNAKSLGLLKS